ncbi:probable LRR receptor-like serine/threonine-protein kinase At3g47570 [Ziziphus jujuba]|uniref:Probable LRR receptor-like serine/threonine-protein kinase At3g47570 n=1 Tax=Ziziphus jujuba TaxID=326968 RepID=A0ABM4AHH8_ZIZJJ|nr:probable LRR receptor-like serine/threonine-protein kinase At3g47570 [Ziziphus jujuba]
MDQLSLSGTRFSIYISVFMQIFLLTSLALIPFTVGGNSYNETDKLSLLAFKAQVVEDPFGVLNSWNASLHFCEWSGITCGRRHKRVTVLDVNSHKLKGELSPHIGNLSFLRVLKLYNNSLGEHIPPEIGRLFRLRILRLDNNSFTGEIPGNISHCSSLEKLILAYNNLVGKIPQGIGFLSKLYFIDLISNKLVGEIPTSLGNLSTLEVLAVEINRLHGSIPNSFGQLKSLSNLDVGVNYLSGTIPTSIYNLSSITVFAVLENQFHGSLPPDLAGPTTLPNLQLFYASSNQFDGPIPLTISNASGLVLFEIAKNKFSGKVPSLSRVSNLRSLILEDNNLGYREDDDLNFITSLVNCTNLEVLYLNQNNFGGTLPESLNNISTKLQSLAIANNWIRGSIPTGIGNLIELEFLDAEENHLTGPIPGSIVKLQKLYWLSFSNNNLTGVIPSSIGNLTLLSKLLLHSNNLQGSIPSSLGGCKSLTTLDFFQNNLSGTIPKQLIGLSTLAEGLDLSWNRLTGPIPMEVGNLVNIQYLRLEENKLNGEIPETLGGCTSLMYLHLGGNSLQGNIPSSLVTLRGIEEMDFSRNNLSGKIPMYLQTFHMLKILNLSFNDFEGEVPIHGVFNNVSALSIVGNTRLCGGIPQLNLSSCSFNLYRKHKLSRKAKIIIVSVACGLVALILAIFLLIFCMLRKRIKSTNLGSAFGISFLKVSYGDLFKATDGFSSANLIGVGSFGSVYKGILNQLEAKVVAVKVLKLEASRASKSFVAECKALKRIKHRNLVKIITACSSIDFRGNDFKALVYEFMVNGSLEEWLHPNHGAKSEQEHKHLSLIDRVNISLDVANALNYLHNHCHVPTVHCDLKPSNVLLDSDMNAHIGDFGLVRFLSHQFSSEQTSSLGIRGSIGYMAPEYGMGSEVSTLGDVYSYGILLLEMFTGKRPTDIMFRDGSNLHNFALAGLSNCVEEIVDVMLLQTENEGRNNNNVNQGTHDCLVSVIKIGVACSAELQKERMDMADVVAELCHIKDRLHNHA